LKSFLLLEKRIKNTHEWDIFKDQENILNIEHVNGQYSFRNDNVCLA